jgi:hypothetical protein
MAKAKLKLPDANKVLEDIVNNFNITEGIWTIQASANEKSLGIIELPDGRKAQIKLIVTTDEWDFID